MEGCAVDSSGIAYSTRTVVVDIGCGSGIIGTSLADLADEVIFLDISPEALRVAEENFRTHFGEKKAQFIVSDLLGKLPLQMEYCEVERDLALEQGSSVTSWHLLKWATQTLLLANLPYIKWWDWEHMSPDTRHEPELALFWGDETGFEMYERLFEQLQNPLEKGGGLNPISQGGYRLLIEFGFDQREIAERIISSYGWQYEFFTDYAGVERFCEIQL
jgi:release factor glutamine methyltransferase